MVRIVLGIAVLALVGVALFFVGRFLSGRIAALGGPQRAILFVVLMLLTALAPIEFFTPWSLSSVTLANAAYLISFLAYLLLVVALWAETKARSDPAVRTMSGGLAVSLFFLTVGALASPVALFLVVAWSLQLPAIASGQITPSLTYVLHDRENWGRGITTEYRIYRQSSLLPVHRLVAKGDACYTDLTPTYYYFLPGPAPKTALLICNFHDALDKFQTCTTTIPIP